jgi:hypothetical protein
MAAEIVVAARVVMTVDTEEIAEATVAISSTT